MRSPSLRAAVLAACAPLLAAPPGDFQERAADKALLAELRQGGLVLYMRHGLTDATRGDRPEGVDLSDCATQRPLTAAGRRLSARVGEGIRAARIPVGRLLSSPLCRARESARLAFRREPEVDLDLMYTANLTAAQKAPILARTRQLLSEPVPAGANRVVVGHAPNLMDLIGYFPKEGTVVVFRPSGNGAFTYLASIPPEGWRRP